MTNKDAVGHFDQSTHSAFINKLFWVAGSFDNSDFKEFVDDMNDSDWKNALPEIAKSKHYKHYRKEREMGQALVDYKKFGFLAEIHHPEHHSFIYQKGKPIASSVSMGVCRISVVYGETREELLAAIEQSAEKIYKEYIAADKKRLKTKKIKVRCAKHANPAKHTLSLTAPVPKQASTLNEAKNASLTPSQKRHTTPPAKPTKISKRKSE